MQDPISLTQEFIRFNTINPPGNEAMLAEFIGPLLIRDGFDVEYIQFDKNRLHLVAEKGLQHEVPPVVFSGHLDVVPLGECAWSDDPFAGIIRDGKIYGRGASDMKGGVAAILCAVHEAYRDARPRGGVRIILTACEETGCQGIEQLVASGYDFGRAQGIVVAEPTANQPAIGHKGGLYLQVRTSGKTAHSSMPHLGDNAIYKAARAILNVESFDFSVEDDALLGQPTINVGKCAGGLNLNSVPDHAEFTIDIRSTTKLCHASVLDRLTCTLGEDTEIDVLVDKRPVYTSEKELFVQRVLNICCVKDMGRGYPKALTYLTDGSVLQDVYEGAPTIILGPGRPEQAHQTDEFCLIEDLKTAVTYYKEILLK